MGMGDALYRDPLMTILINERGGPWVPGDAYPILMHKNVVRLSVSDHIGMLRARRFLFEFSGTWALPSGNAIHQQFDEKFVDVSIRPHPPIVLIGRCCNCCLDLLAHVP